MRFFRWILWRWRLRRAMRGIRNVEMPVGKIRACDIVSGGPMPDKFVASSITFPIPDGTYTISSR